MLKNTKRIFIFILAIVFLVLGVAGLVLPFLQGILFLAVGLILLSILSPSVRVWLDKHTVKYPKLHQLIVKVDTWVRGVIGEV